MTEVMAFMNIVKALKQFDYIDYIRKIKYGISTPSTCIDFIHEYFCILKRGCSLPRSWKRHTVKKGMTYKLYIIKALFIGLLPLHMT